jgi:putative ABC transport system permease protein
MRVSLEVFQEVIVSIKQNKLRSFLTCFSVAWGIFMLIVLLGSGNGLQNGMASQFSSAMVNSLWMSSDITSLDYNGIKKGRRIDLKNEDQAAISRLSKHIDLSSTRYTIPSTTTLAYKEKYGNYEVRTVMPVYRDIELIKMIDGRFLNDRDQSEYRKCGVISTDIRDYYFAKENPLGKYIKINNIAFLIVGVFEDKDDWDNNRCVYIPISTAQQIYSAGHNVSLLAVTLKDITVEQSKELVVKSKAALAKRHSFDANDPRAVHINNNYENMERSVQMIHAIDIFVWFIGIGTIIAGIVGISNIMLISVKERTQEIGVRKALGAQPWSIISMVLQESILLTTMAGYIGLVLGVGVLEIANKMIPPNKAFINPSADIKVAISATIILIVAGAIAGFFPARQAAMIKPIEALRYE